MSINWVKLSEAGEIVKQPNEKVLLKPKSRITLSLTVPKSLQGDGRSPFNIDIRDGEVYLTNQRIIYLPSRPTEEFKSFSAPIFNFEDSFVSSPWFGSWYWSATVKPEKRTTPGSIPRDIPRVTIKLCFNDGGHDEFRACFEELKERLHYARELQRELGSLDDGLPAYEESSAQSTVQEAQQQQQQQQSESGDGSAPAPRGPPPAYEE